MIQSIFCEITHNINITKRSIWGILLSVKQLEIAFVIPLMKLFWDSREYIELFLLHLLKDAVNKSGFFIYLFHFMLGVCSKAGVAFYFINCVQLVTSAALLIGHVINHLKKGMDLVSLWCLVILYYHSLY